VVRGRTVLDRATATINGQALTCLVGANGAGKTTLLRILCGEIKPTSGRIYLGDIEVTRSSLWESARHIALLPQGIGDPPHLTVGEMVALGRFRPGRRLWWGLNEGDRVALAACLGECRLEGLSARPVVQLSGGEKQRAWLAFALAQDKEFLLLDEALDALDFAARQAFFRLLSDVAAGGRGVLLATHDLGLATEFARKVIVLDGGRVAYDGVPSGDLRRFIRAGTWA